MHILRNRHIKHTFVILCALLISCASIVFAKTHASGKTVSSEQFIYELKNTDEFVHAKLVTNWVPDKNELYNLIINPNKRTNIIIDNDTVKMASGVKSPQEIWRFNDDEFNYLIINLFQTISLSEKSLGFPVKLSKYDLFHGHIFAIHTSEAALADIGILFHAKEYPGDLNLGNPESEKNSPFTSKSPEFAYRNFIWLASTGLIYDIDSNSRAIYPTYFLPDGMNRSEPSMKEIVKLYLQARTFVLENLDPYVESLGDVNYFIVNGKPVIFFTY